MTSHFLQALAFVCLFSFIFGHHISLYVMHQRYQTAYVCLKVPRHFITSLLYHCGVFLCLKSLLISICLVIVHSSCFQKFLSWFFSPQDIRTELITVRSLYPLYLLVMLPILILFIYGGTLHLLTENSLRTGPVYYSSASPQPGGHSNICLL